MSASSVGKALSGVTGVPLKSFALLRCSLLEDEEELCYLCLSRYALFVVDRLLEGANGQGILYGAPYRVLERVETDVGNPELFALCFLPKVPLVSRRGSVRPRQERRSNLFSSFLDSLTRAIALARCARCPCFAL
jgi:hypothetical protein